MGKYEILNSVYNYVSYTVLQIYNIVNNSNYYMAESTSGQGEVNPAFWLTIRSGFSSFVPQEKVLLLAIFILYWPNVLAQDG